MKAVRIILTLVIILVAVVALLGVLALTPAIQTWAVRKVVSQQRGLKLDVARVSAGLSSAELKNVHLVKDGLVVTAKQVNARYSAWDYVRRQRLTVDDLTVDDLVIDTRGATSTPATNTPSAGAAEPESVARAANTAAPAGSKQPFNGLLNQAQLPFDLHVARFSVPGRVLLPNEQTATFEVHGSDLITGQRGTIDWHADITSAAPDVRVHALHTSGTALVHITTERRIDILDANALASVEGTGLPTDQLKLEVKAEQPAAGGNEGYNANLSLVRGGTTDQLVTLVGQYNAAAHEIAGVWTVSVRSEQLAALLGGLGLPDVAAEGSGKFAMNPDAAKGSASGELRSSVTHPEKISPDLAAIGSLNLQVAFNGGMADKLLQLEQLAIDATAANGQRLAQIRALQRVGFSLVDKKVTFSDAKGDLARITINNLPLAWAQPFAKGLTIDSGDASMTLAIAAEPDGSHVRVTPIEPLTLRNVTVRKGAEKLADQMTLTVKPQADYSSDHLRASLNELAVTAATGDTVTGHFTADITHLTQAPTIAFTTDTQARFVALLKPYLKADVGPMTIATKSQGSITGQRLHFTSSDTRVLREGNQLIASIELAQPLTVDLQSNAITSDKPGAETLRLTLGSVPLAWAEGLVPDSKFGGQITGGVVSITVRAIDDLTANTTQPILLRGVTIAKAMQPQVQNVDIAADFVATKAGQSLKYEVRRLDGRQGDATLFALSVKGTATLGAKPAITAQGTVAADLGALVQQPALASSASLARGNLDGTFQANVADTIQANGRLTARNLVAKQNNQPLGEAELTLTAAVQPDGSSVLKVPFTLTNGSRRSDLLIDGRLGRAGNTVTFNGSVTSNLLVVDDLKPLAALAPSSASTPSAVNAPPTVPVVSSKGAPPPPAASGSVPDGNTQSTTGARDARPFWAAFGGKVDLDLKRITYGADYVVSAVHGSADVTPAQLALTSLEGNFKDQPFKVAATIVFDDKLAQPYTLTGTADVQNFDIGAVLQAANPNQKPQLETKVTVDAKLNGKGSTLGNLAQNTYGTFDVNGSKGVLRALGNKTGTAINRGSTALGIIGAVTGHDTATAVAELTQKLAELPFDQVTMHVERGADLNLKVSRIEFLSPDTRVVGTGEIRNQPGVAIQNQPMQFNVQLSGKEGMAFLLNRLKVLNGRQDEQGYYVMEKTFTIGGTPANADASDLYKYLASLGIRMGSEGLLKILGK
jgi:hypothetical protein